VGFPNPGDPPSEGKQRNEEQKILESIRDALASPEQS
jgi:hypothetical protein